MYDIPLKIRMFRILRKGWGTMPIHDRAARVMPDEYQDSNGGNRSFALRTDTAFPHGCSANDNIIVPFILWVPGRAVLRQNHDQHNSPICALISYAVSATQRKHTPGTGGIMGGKKRAGDTLPPLSYPPQQKSNQDKIKNYTSQSGLASFSKIIRFYNFFPAKFGCELVEILGSEIYSPNRRWRVRVVWIGVSAAEARGGIFSPWGGGGVDGGGGNCRLCIPKYITWLRIFHSLFQ